ncbi:hypothetical protein [Sulfurihydrogenibium subterraneum]|uniref:hypothetical protein n=1 Tax=Sulfurihydrogenibium subterraneum TaxID=171121 RepID=UPI0012EB8DE4|nr:hypothetical protein [Sulfurihydrogenibium subterraneum]
MKKLDRILKLLENQINNDTYKLLETRKNIFEKNMYKENLLNQLHNTEISTIVESIADLKIKINYINFLQKKLEEIQNQLKDLYEEETKIIDSIKEKNAYKKALEKYMYKKQLQMEVKAQFEESIKNSDIYNRNFSNYNS